MICHKVALRNIKVYPVYLLSKIGINILLLIKNIANQYFEEVKYVYLNTFKIYRGIPVLFGHSVGYRLLYKINNETS